MLEGTLFFGVKEGGTRHRHRHKTQDTDTDTTILHTQTHTGTVTEGREGPFKGCGTDTHVTAQQEQDQNGTQDSNTKHHCARENQTQEV